MRGLIIYDVESTSKEGRRLRSRLSRVCKDYGIRVQLSAFEFDLKQRDWRKLKSRLRILLKSEASALVSVYFIRHGSEVIPRTKQRQLVF